MDTSLFKTAAEKCRVCITECDKVYRLFSIVEDRQWLCEMLQNCMDALRDCAAECEIGSMNVRPAIECSGLLYRAADCCKYFDDDVSKSCRNMLIETKNACDKLFN